MSLTSQELEDFYAFGCQRVAEGTATSLDELLLHWDASRNRSDANDAIREGIEDYRIGEHRSAEETLAELRRDSDQSHA